MSYEEFQRMYEIESEKLYEYFVRFSEDEILDLIAQKKWDAQYQIWRAISDKGSDKSIRPLFEVVSDLKIEYLVRYHACTALFQLANISDDEFKGMVQFGLDKNGERVNQEQAIEQLRKMLAEYLS